MVSNRTELLSRSQIAFAARRTRALWYGSFLYGTDGKLRYHLKVLLEGVISRLDPVTFARMFAVFQQCLGSIEQNKPDDPSHFFTLFKTLLQRRLVSFRAPEPRQDVPMDDVHTGCACDAGGAV